MPANSEPKRLKPNSISSKNLKIECVNWQILTVTFPLNIPFKVRSNAITNIAIFATLSTYSITALATFLQNWSNVTRSLASIASRAHGIQSSRPPRRRPSGMLMLQRAGKLLNHGRACQRCDIFSRTGLCLVPNAWRRPRLSSLL